LLAQLQRARLVICLQERVCRKRQGFAGRGDLQL
jgi:hypothetical protein